MEIQELIKCTIMRGGTSKGIFLHRNGLPRDTEMRDKVIRRIFGAPDSREIDGLAGAITGKLLPTENLADTLNVPGEGEFEISIVDAAIPVAFIRAGALGLKGTESPKEIDADRGLLNRIEKIRSVAAETIGLTDD